MERKTKIVLNGQPFDATVIPVRSSQEHWNEYLLADEAVVRIKLVVTEIYRIDGMFDPEGNPVYHIKSGNVASVIAPEELKRLPKSGDKS